MYEDHCVFCDSRNVRTDSALLQGARDPDGPVDQAKAKKDAKV